MLEQYTRNWQSLENRSYEVKRGEKKVVGHFSPGLEKLSRCLLRRVESGTISRKRQVAMLKRTKRMVNRLPEVNRAILSKSNIKMRLFSPSHESPTEN